MKARILITLLAVAAVAGCSIPGIQGITPGTTIGGGNGLEITSFTAEPNTVFSGSTVRVIMEVTNNGGTTVSQGNSMAQLIGNLEFGGTKSCVGLDNTSCQTKTGCSWNDSSSTCSGTYSVSTSTMTWHGTSQYQLLKEMKAEDVVRGLSAGTDRIMWTLSTPSLTAGQTRTDSFTGRVYSEYQTVSQGTVWVYTDAEAEATRTAGRTMEKSTFTSSKGPVGISVTVQPDPIIIYGNDQTFSLNIQLSNLATGTIYQPNNISYDVSSTSNKQIVSDALNKVSIGINKTSDLDITNPEECTQGLQELVAGKPTTVICDFNITGTVDAFKSFPINIVVSYGYFTENKVDVTVQGK
jgi:hypothetical protein